MAKNNSELVYQIEDMIKKYNKKPEKKVKKKERQIFQVGHMDLDQKKGKVEMSMQLGK